MTAKRFSPQKKQSCLKQAKHYNVKQTTRKQWDNISNARGCQDKERNCCFLHQMAYNATIYANATIQTYIPSVR
jgi:hypothetical protein